ncbi:PLP-binding domain-containing protein [Frankia sp. R43]|uniref:YggS family pyridoxal phosphate enzyme n=1 Tax=Frankia sp. R43 TaxID=269536 RepID=UPI0006CA255B|nr:YggS family pyridoxal phosphate enzyme [Frankia sp. R43]KPM55599.1 PLP-binding domain-containing protein [Frankia sp. R43]
MSVVDPRRAEGLRSRLTVVRGRIVMAARAAGRDPEDLTLIAVSKTWPFEDVVALCSLGVRHFAENREQEAGPKVEAVRRVLATLPALSAAPGPGNAGAGNRPPTGRITLAGPPDGAWFPSRADGLATLGSAVRVDVPVWHYVGQLQRNKARSVAGWAHCVQSVDRVRLAETLSRVATESGSTIAVCIQVSLDRVGDVAVPSVATVDKAFPTRENSAASPPVAAERGGARPEDVPALAELVARAPGLVLAGVMAVAPRGVPPRPAFARLRVVSERLRGDFPEATMVSAGMSSDLEDAIAEGATHLRIGTALFGERHGVP